MNKDRANIHLIQALIHTFIALGTFKVYRSSAGSGKTFTLVLEYLKLILMDDNPFAFRSILAMTFTNKAANEMKERVLLVLKALIKNQDQFLVNLYSEQTKLSPEELQERATKRLEIILHNYTELSILTIDKFVYRVIRSFAKDLDVAADFQVEMDSEGLLRNGIEQLIAQIGSHPELSQLLTDFAIAKSDEEKSWDIENDIYGIAKILLKEGHEQALGELADFTIQDFKNIRKELGERIARFEATISKLGAEAMQVINDAGVDLASFYYGKNGIGGYFNRIAKKDFSKLEPNRYVQKTIGENVWSKKNGTDADAITGIASALAEKYCEIENLAQNSGQDYQLFLVLRQNIYGLSVLNEVNKIVQEIKDGAGLVLISDFNKKVAEIIHKEPAPFIYEKIGNRYKHFLIDEFQDNSILQWQNLLPLVDNSLSMGHYNLLVGDGKQAIYRWRGGEVEQFSELPKIFGRQNKPYLAEFEKSLSQYYKSAVLDTNFRSSKEVVSFNNEMYATLALNLNEELKPIYSGLEQKFKANAPDGYVRAEIIDAKEDTEDGHLQRTLTGIREALEDGFSLADIAIIVRTRFSGLRLADFLLENGIDVISSDSLLLESSSDVRLVIHFLRLYIDAHSVRDQIEIIKILEEPDCLHDVLIQFKMFNPNSREIKLDFNKYLVSKGIVLFPANSSSLHLYAKVEEIIRSFRLGEHNRPFLEGLLEQVLQFSKRYGDSLYQFLQYWEENRSKLAVSSAGQSDAVEIITIHKSKGLQYPVVIIPFCNWQLTTKTENTWVKLNDEVEGPQYSVLPMAKSKLAGTKYAAIVEQENARQLLDNLNLLYVATTRAESRLIMISDRRTGNRISKYLNPYLENHPSFHSGRDALVEGERHANVAEEKVSEQTDEYGIVGIESSRKLEVSTEWTETWLRNEDASEDLSEALRYGNLLHSVLSRIEHYSDRQDVIQYFLRRGTANQEMMHQVEKDLNGLFSDPIFTKWFDGNGTVLCEREIISGGKVFRPDRIINYTNKSVVIDYKTGQPRPDHAQQIRVYGELVRQITAKEVEQFLVYTDSKTILPIR